MDLRRRDFLRVGGGGLVLLAATGTPGWAESWLETARPTPDGTGGAPLLVTIFLRGGADALHLAPPVGDARYQALRGPLAVESPLRLPDGSPGRADFGLHPAMAPLLPLAERGRLAVVVAAGSPHETRSHFSAQDFMEAGLAGGAGLGARLEEGWLARALRPQETGSGFERSFATLALGDALPLALRGSGAFSIGDPRSFGLPASSEALRVLAARCASGGSDPAALAGGAALAAIGEYERRTGFESMPGRQRRPRERSRLAERVDELAMLVDAGLPVRAACLESSGWDTHRGQVEAGTRMEMPSTADRGDRRASGRDRNRKGGGGARIEDLALALARLDERFTGRRDWLAVVMTEFGRTVRPNGSGGTDHGHGSLMLVAGSRVQGGFRGDWPGLGEASLYEGRDLPVTTDYRSVLCEVLRAHLGTDAAADVFPAFTPRPVGVV